METRSRFELPTVRVVWLFQIPHRSSTELPDRLSRHVLHSIAGSAINYMRGYLDIFVFFEIHVLRSFTKAIAHMKPDAFEMMKSEIHVLESSAGSEKIRYTATVNRLMRIIARMIDFVVSITKYRCRSPFELRKAVPENTPPGDLIYCTICR